jgi:hypothetical protein
MESVKNEVFREMVQRENNSTEPIKSWKIYVAIGNVPQLTARTIEGVWLQARKYILEQQDEWWGEYVDNRPDDDHTICGYVDYIISFVPNSIILWIQPADELSRSEEIFEGEEYDQSVPDEPIHQTRERYRQ